MTRTTDTPPRVNKSLKEAVVARWVIAMVDIVLRDKREERPDGFGTYDEKPPAYGVQKNYGT